MKRFKFEKVKMNGIFILPTVGITKIHTYSENLIKYHLCFAWLKLHFSILLYAKRDDE